MGPIKYQLQSLTQYIKSLKDHKHYSIQSKFRKASVLQVQTCYHLGAFGFLTKAFFLSRGYF